MSVSTPSYVASGVQVEPMSISARRDACSPSRRRATTARRRPSPSAMTRSRSATSSHPLADGDLLLQGRHARSQDLLRARVVGERGRSRRHHVVPGPAPPADLVPTAMGTNPSTPIVAPGATFSVTDTVQNLGPGASESSKTRYYLSLDAVKSAGDIAPDRDPLGSESRCRGHPYRDGDREDPRGDSARSLLPAGLRR